MIYDLIVRINSVSIYTNIGKSLSTNLTQFPKLFVSSKEQTIKNIGEFVNQYKGKRILCIGGFFDNRFNNYEDLSDPVRYTSFSSNICTYYTMILLNKLKESDCIIDQYLFDPNEDIVKDIITNYYFLYDHIINDIEFKQFPYYNNIFKSLKSRKLIYDKSNMTQFLMVSFNLKHSKEKNKRHEYLEQLGILSINKTHKPRQYYSTLLDSYFSLMIPSFNADHFSYYRFLECLYCNTIPVIHYKCKINMLPQKIQDFIIDNNLVIKSYNDIKNLNYWDIIESLMELTNDLLND